jgi:PqqD family protein of HPr-rel-A system
VQAATLWRLLPGQSLQHRLWEDECVLYNDLTGDTHRLDAAALEVLLALQAAPLSFAALCAALEIDAADAPVREALEATLFALAKIALVESAAC